MLSRATPESCSHDLMRRSDKIPALVTPFHTYCELKAEFFYTVAEWQLGVFRIGGTLHRLLGGASVIYIARHVQRLRAARPVGRLSQDDAGSGPCDPEPSNRTRSSTGRRHQDQRYGACDPSRGQRDRVGPDDLCLPAGAARRCAGLQLSVGGPALCQQQPLPHPRFCLL
jgi:hypothetical protein